MVVRALGGLRVDRGRDSPGIHRLRRAGSFRQVLTVVSFTQAENDDRERMRAIDDELAHLWMVRTFLKHSDEAAEDEELAEVHRALYDYALALGPSVDREDAGRYLTVAKKKFAKLRNATELFIAIQPEVSGHMNFAMAAKSLRLTVDRIAKLLP